jgi:hypothetical protein
MWKANQINIIQQGTSRIYENMVYRLNSINFNYIIYTYGIGGKSEPRPVKAWNHSCCTGTWLHGAVSVYLPLTCYLSICLISIFLSFYFSSCLSFLLSCFTYIYIYTYTLRQTYITSLGILLLSDDIHETSCFDCLKLAKLKPWEGLYFLHLKLGKLTPWGVPIFSISPIYFARSQLQDLTCKNIGELGTLPWFCSIWFDVSGLAGGEFIRKEVYLRSRLSYIDVWYSWIEDGLAFVLVDMGWLVSGLNLQTFFWIDLCEDMGQ